MLRMIVGRLVGAVLVVAIVASFGFLALRAAPGGPFDQERAMDPTVAENIRRQHQMDEPLVKQWASYLWDVAHGDLRWSMTSPERVNTIIRRNFPYSLTLGLTALAFAVGTGVLLGLVAAANHNKLADHAAMLVALVGISVPAFVLGPVLILVFSLGLGWFPPARMEGMSGLILPALTLGLIYMGVVARLTRSGMLETIRQDYVRTARAKGLAPRQVLFKHALRLGILPVVTYIAPATAYLITGSVVVETIFQIPGLGTYLTGSVIDRDYTTLSGVMIVYCSFLVALNLLVDIAYGFLDPRTRQGQ